MQTQLASHLIDTPSGREAEAILRSCVHCGFCNATCPTYQLIGDEKDGPRGRIYLIKAVLEGKDASATTQHHLDRCLTCRACETTCPSGVNYHRLLDIGREEVDRQVTRPAGQRLVRWLTTEIMPRKTVFGALLRVGQFFRAVLPARLRAKIPARDHTLRPAPTAQHRRKMLLLEGCVQPAMAPAINRATARVLDAIGISLAAAPGAACCGALRQHLGAQDKAADDMRRNIDAWWPALQSGAEAVVINTSGCAPQVKDYGSVLADDETYRSRAADISNTSFDLAEILLKEEPALIAELEGRSPSRTGITVAFHSPCTLQHGQGITGVVERLLTAAGYALTPVSDSHLCCGSAGTYSLFQPALSEQLRTDKLAALSMHQPDVIATANVGCLAHMAPATGIPVKHWIELLDDALS